MFGWLSRLTGMVRGRAKTSRGRRLTVRGSYDAAQTTDENRKHWENADSLSADAVNDPDTRQKLRDRARYECRNNGYAGGMVESVANDVVGTGPRLQLTIPGVAREVSRGVENAYHNWGRAADLAEDLRVLDMADFRDGEGLAIMANNPMLPQSGMTPVTLDLTAYESEQCADPWNTGLDPLYVDGVRKDPWGNPTEYTFLESHPGGLRSWFPYKTHKIPAAQVLHWFKPDRAGQTRGVSRMAPGLPLYAQLRRYTLATLGAAELAAMLAGILKTDQPAADGAEVTVESMDTVELVRNALLTLPNQWDATQFKPEQPTGTYKEFKGEILNEIGRGGQVPFNVIAGNSSGYNYSSGRLDHLMYHRMVRVKRARMRARILDRIFAMWVIEAILVKAIPANLPPISTWSWEWHWDGFESIDPQKDAQCDETELRNNTTTLAAIYARKGLDWEEMLRQRARERDLIRELGLSEGVALPTPAPQPAQEEEVANAA